MGRLSLLALPALLVLAAPAVAQTFPKFTGFVVDEADVLPPAVEADLTANACEAEASRAPAEREKIAGPIEMQAG